MNAQQIIDCFNSGLTSSKELQRDIEALNMTSDTVTYDVAMDSPKVAVLIRNGKRVN